MIAVDVMRACYLNHAVTVWFFSGDGDFVQLINEVFHAGKCANVWAFLSGVNEEIRYVVDDFLLLDKNFFLSDEEVAAPMSDSAVEPAELTAETHTVVSSRLFQILILCKGITWDWGNAASNS